MWRRCAGRGANTTPTRPATRTAAGLAASPPGGGGGRGARPRRGGEAGGAPRGGRGGRVPRRGGRAADGSGELRVPPYELFPAPGLPGELRRGRRRAGLSPRRYRVGLEPVGTGVERAAT